MKTTNELRDELQKTTDELRALIGLNYFKKVKHGGSKKMIKTLKEYDELRAKNNKKIEAIAGSELKLDHYNYLIIARDEILSGWGVAQGKNAYTYLLVDGDGVKLHAVIDRVKKHGFTNVNYYFLNSENIPVRRGVNTVRFIETSPLFNGERS